MPPSLPEPGQYRHITFTRETYQFERRTRAYGPRPPGQEYRPQHAQEILQDITQAVQQISQTRRGYGIDPEQLFVLEFKNIVIDLRAIFERFGAWVVNEFRDKVNGQDVYRLLVQFPTETSRQLLLDENRLYEAEEADSVTLPPGMRQNFFDALQTARCVSRDERIGVRLREEGFPETEAFYLDVDLWHPGDQDSVRKVLGDIRSMCASYDGQLTEEVRTSSLLLIKVHGSRQLAEALLELDWVARVDLPPKLSRAYSEIFGNVQSPDPMPIPLDDDPLVCVVDSGVVSGHPFLKNWIVEERDFDTGENTPTDLNGHGTSVAGLVVYGDIANCLESNQWQPKVRVCSAKVLRHDPTFGKADIPEHHRAEWFIERAIRYFAEERQCQIFNLSIENSIEVYRGGRQFPWAEKLDELARELDVVIVQIAGNCEPPIPDSVAIREDFQKAVRDSLLKDENLRICNPGTAALALTVGALARSDALGDHVKPIGVRLKDAFAGAPAHAPAPFTRVGWGLSYGGSNTSIKPDVVAYGGNWAIQTIAGGSPNWKSFILLGEPTIQREDASGRFITARDGTSFACPHIAHAAAIAASSLERTLGQSPSANLIRALVGSATYSPPCPPDWLGSEEETLRLIGYGTCSVDDLTASKKNRVRLVAMDEVELDKLHIYRVAIPEIFLATKGKRGITVALAYDPPIRASRKEYLANTMWVEALHGLTTEEVEIYRAKNASPDVDTLPAKNQLELRPTKTDVQWSTLQVRRLEKQTKLKIPTGETEPVVHFVVGCQQRFPTGFDYKQRYGLVVLFWHESEQIELYQELRVRDRVRLKAARIRT